ncbi:MAG: VirB4 family type IV secretion system protein [Proteobacteria bacterium]|nr:VirB4 family type IV secretion system protein [Pseudomonadota bacterium]
MKRGTALRRELPVAFRIPYRAQLSPNVVRTEAGDYVQVFRIDGASFETADDEVLNNWHERLNVLWRNIAAPNVALWVHVIRRRERVSSGDTSDATAEDFAERLSIRYQARLSTETLMVNELYLSTAYRPIAGAAPNLVARLLKREGEPASAGGARRRARCLREAGANSKLLARPLRSRAAGRV